MKTDEAIAIVLESTFPLFTGGAYKQLKVDFENSEDLATAIGLLHQHLVGKFSQTIAEIIFGYSTVGEDDKPKVVEFDIVQQEELKKYIRQAVTLYENLSRMKNNELHRRYRVVIGEHIARKRHKLEILGNEHDRNAFFNEVEAEAEWEYWNAKITWTPNEFVALSFGKDPRVVNEVTLRDRRQPGPSPFTSGFLDRLDSVNRSIEAKIIKAPLQPAPISKWARANGIQLPPEMARMLRKQEAGKIQGNTLHRMYEIILGIAVSQYGYDVLLLEENAQGNIAKAMYNDIASVGADISPRTLIDYLKVAATWARSEINHPIIEHARKTAAAEKGRPASTKEKTTR